MHILCVIKATTYIQEESNGNKSLKDNVSQPKLSQAEENIFSSMWKNLIYKVN